MIFAKHTAQLKESRILEYEESCTESSSDDDIPMRIDDDLDTPGFRKENEESLLTKKEKRDSKKNSTYKISGQKRSKTKVVTEE